MNVAVPGDKPQMTEFYTPSSSGTEENLDRLLKTVISSISQEVDRRLGDSGLTDAQSIPMLLIHSGRCSTATEVARAADLDVGAVSRMLGRIESRGLLSRERSIDDRRVVRLHLTDVGGVIASKIHDVVSEVTKVHLAGFTVEECQTLIAQLRRIRTNGARRK